MPQPPENDGIEPLEDIREYDVTGLKGIEHVRFDVIYDRGPRAAERLARQNQAILEALRRMRDHPDEVAEIKKKHAERERTKPVTWHRTRSPARAGADTTPPCDRDAPARARRFGPGPRFPRC